MPESEHEFATSTEESASLQALQEQVGSLQTILVAALMALLLLSVGVNIYLFRQVDMVSKELGIATRLVRDFETNKKPLINTFVSNLVVYARTHQDFNPILQKFGLPPSAPLQATPPSSAPGIPPKK
jgi:hypothetical protein